MEIDRQIQRAALDPHLRRRLRTNLDQLAISRPQIAQELASDIPKTNATLVRGRWGMRTLNVGTERPFHSPDPLTETLDLLRDLNPNLRLATPLALCGVGNGYVLNALTTWNSPVLIIEPDPRALLAPFLIHDYSSPRGPIQSDRFHWFVGETWENQLRELVATQCDFQLPKVFIRQTPESAAIQLALQNISQETPACV